MLRQRGRAAVPVKIRYKQGRAPTHPVATTEYRRAAHLGTPPRRADAVRLRRGRARGGVEQLRNGVPRRLQRARKGAVLAAGGASRAPRLCARRRMRGRGGWVETSGRAVPHGAVCSRVSPPSSVVQVHASPPYTGVWNRARRPVGSSRGRAHTCTAGPGACTAVSDTVGRSGAQALVRKPLPVVSTSVFFLPAGARDRLYAFCSA